MHIRELEVSGFKSFPHRVRLEFSPGLTAIIGPNGCGKSNLVDAIRWVLGEQNARTLRAERMEELIFGGNRRLRALGRAEVSLTLDNSDRRLPLDYGEVRITRRLFRSGEAEYLLNQVPCRMRDIQQMLWDTGVSRQGFAVIGQGQVEEFLAAAPEERRAFLEEVAGIVRYRHRKKEAGQKLAETQGHLGRLRDIMAELEAQLASMEGEVEAARKYQQVAEEIAALEKELRFSLLNSLRSQKARLLARSEELATELTGVRQLETRLGEEKAHRQARLEALERELELARTAWGEAAARRQEAELAVRAAAQELELLRREESRVRSRLMELEERIRGCETEILSARAELRRAEQARCELEDREAASMQELASIEARWAEAMRRREERRAAWHQKWLEFLELQNRLQAATEEWQLSYTQGQRAYGERDRLRKELEALDAEKREAGRRRSELQTRMEQLEGEREELRRQVRQEQEKLDRLREEAERVRNSWQDHRNRLALLREWQQGHEGYSQAVKALLSARGRLWPDHQGLIGVVAEIIRVPAELEAALEAALGGALQHLVTRTEADAQRAIAYLKATGAGRATFLPLESIRPRHLGVDRAVTKWAGVVGVGSELVEVAPDCEIVALHLLGDLLVVSRLDQALALARRLGYRVRLVTLEGELVHPGGSITGGHSRKRSGGLLSRLREAAELAARVEAEGRHFNSLREEVAAAEARLAKQQELEQEQQERLWRLKSELEGETRREQHLAERLREAAEKLAVTELELAQWEEDFRQLTSQRQQLEEKAAEFQPVVAEGPSESEAFDGEAETRRQELLATAAELRGHLARARQEEERLRGRLLGLEETGEHLRREQEAEKAQLDRLCSQVAAGEEGLVRLQVLAKERAGEEEEHALGCARKESEVREARAALIGIEERIARTEERRLTIERQLDHLEAERREVEATWRAQVDWLAERHGWSEEQGLPQAVRREAEIKRLLASKQEERERLGAVDLAVLAEYRRLEERHRFLARQAADLESAQATLSRLVADVERLMEERLKNALETVNAQLQPVFSSLFGGGRAWLEPREPGRLLEGGLELAVQLPGKRLPNLALLSGGEKALASIAVLFALLLVKPSPFCLLDEIDASLDEANVTRFARFLRELASKQQFIVVSHRASTVEVADSVYGLTMEEEGVSKLLALRLPQDGQRHRDHSTG
ncbi:MAG: chromosome segregation protein SMC [Clostridia bacterium]|nr:chromosome segregation protein SMC [Clostridia bacterium]MDH7572422.1 chromosome segregation protein SMC [Clostridia bacterium]